MTRPDRRNWLRWLSAIATIALWAASAFGQPAPPGSEPQANSGVRQRIKRKAVIVGDDGRVVEFEGEGEGEGEHPFTWVHDGQVVHPGVEELSVVFRDLGLGRGFLGVEMTALTESLRDFFGVPRGRGVLIAEVVAASPAEAAGLRVGDIVTRADGQPVRGPGGLAAAVRARKQGEVMEIEAWRDRQPLSLAVRIEEQERPVVKVRRRQREIILEPLAGGGEHTVGEHTVVLVDDAMGQVLEYLEGGEWKQRVERLGGTEWSQVEARVRELEGQLRELERKLRALEKTP